MPMDREKFERLRGENIEGRLIHKALEYLKENKDKAFTYEEIREVAEEAVRDYIKSEYEVEPSGISLKEESLRRNRSVASDNILGTWYYAYGRERR